MQPNPFKIAQQQFDRVAGLLNLDADLTEILRWPMNEITCSIPVQMDDSSLRHFVAHRIQHNNALGPFKGGFRFHPSQGQEVLRALAMWTTWKLAVMDIPLGGAYGGMTIDPATLSWTENERLMRGYTRAMFRFMGENVDILAPDLGTTAQMMGWILDEYCLLRGKYSPAVVTGKPVGGGGSLGRSAAGGFGAVIAIREALHHLGLNGRDLTAAIQGFGNAAQHAAIAFKEIIGGKVACVSCWDREERISLTFSHPQEIDPRFLQTITDQYGTIDKEAARAAGYRIEPGEEWIRKDVEILIPAALEAQINADTVQQIRGRVKLVAEVANGPTTPEAEEVLLQNGIYLIPDFVCNSGGVLVSYFEQVQGRQLLWWDQAMVLRWLEQKMAHAFKAMHHFAEQNNRSTREAAMMVAVQRVVDAMQKRGWH